MYHALLDAQGACPGADPHYAVAPGTLGRHLELLAGEGMRASSVRDLLEAGDAGGRVGFTFDDGHESNAAAAQAIIAAGGTADLFVNPSLVGAPRYLDWSALADLARAGISIQSHGHTHRYFDELSEAEIGEELARSKAAIEDRIGRPVTVFAPPGGRLTPRVAPVAQRLGYRAICSSRAGLWRADASAWDIPRLAVLASTGEAQFRRWIAMDRWEMARIGMRHRALAAAKALLGNRGYERLRAGLLAAGPRRGRAS
ncbi:MAG: polysaccharide deacetylase family protein [Lysobacter sp.]|nr:polysaccharide deacetylase family protein [Lysobacter sp.]